MRIRWRNLELPTRVVAEETTGQYGDVGVAAHQAPTLAELDELAQALNGGLLDALEAPPHLGIAIREP